MSQPQRWYFTFMERQEELKNKYAVFTGTHDEARQKMVNNFGNKWAFQYGEDEWVDEDGTTQDEKFNLTELEW